MDRTTEFSPSVGHPGEQWRTQLAEAFGQLETERCDDSTEVFAGRLSSAALGRAAVFDVAGTPQIVRRTRRSISLAPADPLKVCIQRAGRATVHQGSVEVVVTPGQLAVYDTGRPYEIRLEGHWQCAVMTVPRASLLLPDSALSAAMATALPAGTGLGGVLTHWLTTCLESPAPPLTVRSMLGEAGVQLVGSLVCGPDVPAPGSDDLLRARIGHFLRANVSDPDLSHAAVAAAHNVSDRTLHRLFESEPMTVVEMIRHLRLEGTYGDLLNPALRRISVMAIAARWGYQDQAHFTRAFRTKYGVTPARLRRDREMPD